MRALLTVTKQRQDVRYRRGETVKCNSNIDISRDKEFQKWSRVHCTPYGSVGGPTFVVPHVSRRSAAGFLVVRRPMVGQVVCQDGLEQLQLDGHSQEQGAPN